MKSFHAKILTSTLILACAALTASADSYTFDFYKLGRGVANGDFLPSDAHFTILNDRVSSNVTGSPKDFSGDLQFTQAGVIATATASYNNSVAAVVQDRETNWTANRSKGAGLGVYHYMGASVNLVTSDDNITNGEMLTITFNQQVRLTTIGLNDDGHNIFSQTNNEWYYLNGFKRQLIGTDLVDMIGTQFTFAYDNDSSVSPKAYQFYLSSLTVSTVPDSGSTVALIGAALLGFAALRRRFVS